MDLETTISLMAASLYDHDRVAHPADKRKAAIRDARLLVQEVNDTKLYEPVK